jgi:microcystin-dependent protein
MRRVETYVGQQVYEWLFSSQAQQTMTAIAKVCAAMFGTSGIVNGLSCTPTSPATMTVQVGAGEIYQMEALEATTCGTLPADTTHQILKQGIQLGTYTTSSFAAPTTSGQSINYLIEAQYQDSDISLDPTTGNSPVVLQFYNSANPSQPWSGPNNSGSTSNTFRDGVIAYQIKAGAAATTGTQVTPTPDSGWIGLWVVTVPFGASSLTSGNISQYSTAPILPSTGILGSIITSGLLYGTDNGSANVVQASFPLPSTTIADNQPFWVKIKNTNTGATTFTPNPGIVSASPVVGAAHQALQGGELVANGRALFIWRQDITSYVLVECTGGAMQTAAATASQHTPQAGQVQRNAFNYASAAGGTANALTATLTPAPTSYTDDLTVVVRVASANTGATTLNVNGLGATAVVGAGHQPLQGGELAANGFACFAYSQALASFILLWTTGGAEPVAPATQSQHAVQFAQLGNRAGEVCFFATSSPPIGFLAADGSAVSRTTYATLYSAIGTTFGAGDGSTTFNLPDLRGRFPRGYDNGAGVDPGRAFGSVQADSFASHNHGVNDPTHAHSSSAAASGNQILAAGSNGAAINGNSTGFASTGITIQSTGGTETRPKNVALLACIKY